PPGRTWPPPSRRSRPPRTLTPSAASSRSSSATRGSDIMDKNVLIRRLMATFVEELAEHVGALNRDLLGLEKATAREERAEWLKSLFRTAHSLKGAARSVNLNVIETACHYLE